MSDRGMGDFFPRDTTTMDGQIDVFLKILIYDYKIKFIKILTPWKGKHYRHHRVYRLGILCLFNRKLSLVQKCTRKVGES